MYGSDGYERGGTKKGASIRHHRCGQLILRSSSKSCEYLSKTVVFIFFHIGFIAELREPIKSRNQLLVVCYKNHSFGNLTIIRRFFDKGAVDYEPNDIIDDLMAHIERPNGGFDDGQH